MSTKGQGHSFLSDLIFLNFFSSVTTWPVETKFHVEPPWDGGTKAYSNGPGHIIKMATMPMFCKNLLWNRKADDLET